MLRVYQWLDAGRHQFKSVIVDSVSELQTKCLENLAGNQQMSQQQWGELLRHMGQLLRNLRDLTMHRSNPLEAVVLTAMTRSSTDNRFHPYLQGQLAIQAPYFFDILGYLQVESWPNVDPTQPPYKARRLYIESTDFAEAGERVQGRLGAYIDQADLDITAMLDRIYGTRPAAPAAATE